MLLPAHRPAAAARALRAPSPPRAATMRCTQLLCVAAAAVLLALAGNVHSQYHTEVETLDDSCDAQVGHAMCRLLNYAPLPQEGCCRSVPLTAAADTSDVAHRCRSWTSCGATTRPPPWRPWQAATTTA